MHQPPREILPPSLYRYPPGTGFAIAFAVMIPVYALAAFTL